jgi:hypothetical protein
MKTKDAQAAQSLGVVFWSRNSLLKNSFQRRPDEPKAIIDVLFAWSCWKSRFLAALGMTRDGNFSTKS